MVAPSSTSERETVTSFHALLPATNFVLLSLAFVAERMSESLADNVNFLTDVEQYQEKSVLATNASNIGQTAFTANWMPLADSQSYVVTLYKNLLTGTGTETWDFTNKTDSKPEGWDSNCNRYDNTNFEKATPALRMSHDGEYLKAAHRDGMVSNIAFWYRASTTGNTLTIEAFKDGEWQLAADSIKPEKDFCSHSSNPGHLQGAALVSVRILRACKRSYHTPFHSLLADGHKGRALQWIFGDTLIPFLAASFGQ